MSDDVTQSSGNVFADLGFADAEAELVKARLVRDVRAAIVERGLTRSQAAERMGVTQPDVSAMLDGRVGGYAVERLTQCLRALDREADLSGRHGLQQGRAGP